MRLQSRSSRRRHQGVLRLRFPHNNRRGVFEKLALALYAHNRNNAPFLYKILGSFRESDEANCLRVFYENGECFLAAIRNIAIGEVLTVSPDAITAPTFEEEAEFSNTLRLMAKIEFENAPVFTKALSFREKAAVVRPDGIDVIFSSKFDPELNKRVAKYTMDREMGITNFHVGLKRLNDEFNQKRVKDLFDLEELYAKLNEEFEDENMCVQITQT